MYILFCNFGKLVDQNAEPRLGTYSNLEWNPPLRLFYDIHYFCGIALVLNVTIPGPLRGGIASRIDGSPV